MREIRGENRPGIVLMGRWACEGVKSAEALPTSIPKNNPLPNSTCRLRLDDLNVEVGPETADCNVFFVVEAEAPPM